MMFLKFCAKCVRVLAFSCHIFLAHLQVFLFCIFAFFLFSPLFHGNEAQNCLCQSSGRFLWSSSHLVKEILKLLNKTEQRVNKLVKKKVLRRQTKEWKAICFDDFSRYSIEKLFISVIIKHEGQLKKLKLHNIKVLSTTVCR